MATNTDLALAASVLSAVRVGRTEWCYEEWQTGLWVVSSDDLRGYGRAHRRGEQDAYSLWCSDTVARRPNASERSRYEAI